jgi:hypothetical protein
VSIILGDMAKRSKWNYSRESGYRLRSSKSTENHRDQPSLHHIAEQLEVSGPDCPTNISTGMLSNYDYPFGVHSTTNLSTSCLVVCCIEALQGKTPLLHAKLPHRISRLYQNN